jgi:glutamate-1-semialdehyde 2,1-aminomutase
VWFDTSAVTEAGAFEAIIQTAGHRKLLYGSDLPMSHLRGRCVAIGDSFVWLYPENMPTETPYASIEPVLVGLESLRTLKLAARHTHLSDEQVEDVFFNNAQSLFSRGVSSTG